MLCIGLHRSTELGNSGYSAVWDQSACLCLFVCLGHRDVVGRVGEEEAQSSEGLVFVRLKSLDFILRKSELLKNG